MQRGVTPTEGTGIAYVNARSEYRLSSGWKTLNTGNSQSVPSHPWHALMSSDRSGQQREPSAEHPAPPAAVSPECCSAETLHGIRRPRLLWRPLFS